MVYGIASINEQKSIMKKILLVSLVFAILSSYSTSVYGQESVGIENEQIRKAEQIKSAIEEEQKLADRGFGYVKGSERTQPRNGISGDELRRTGCNNVLDALVGKVPGLNITPSNLPGEEATAYIRGINSVKGPITPLFIVDGVIVESLLDVSIYVVDYVEVLKDASIYGSRGANGAILVHTKGAK